MKNKGFSLIEVLIVVSLIGVLSAIVYPNYKKFKALEGSIQEIESLYKKNNYEDFLERLNDPLILKDLKEYKGEITERFHKKIENFNVFYLNGKFYPEKQNEYIFITSRCLKINKPFIMFSCSNGKKRCFYKPNKDLSEPDLSQTINCDDL
tara:strand:- start:462 stop:914 length:453 start_codon:yes stop_codon:yes gene_type:complete